MAVDIFQDAFNNQIAQLLNAFPANHIIEDTGKPFWSGLKRAPQILEFSVDDPLHLELVQSGANIFATMLNIPLENDKLTVAKIASKANRKPFIPKKVKIETEEKKEKSNEPVEIDADDENECKRLGQELRQLNINKAKAPTPIEFEKDDPTNWHIEFMSGVSNLRVIFLLMFRQETTRLKKLTTLRLN
jgi:ubiquitin-activating enzyme E1